MRSQAELEAMARRIIDGNRYMTIATADDEGHPWATPVYFSPDGYTHMYWISSPDAQHSRNLAARAEIGVVVFDSQVCIGGAEAVYMEGAGSGGVGPDLGAVCGGVPSAFRLCVVALYGLLNVKLGVSGGWLQLLLVAQRRAVPSRGGCGSTVA